MRAHTCVILMQSIISMQLFFKLFFSDSFIDYPTSLHPFQLFNWYNHNPLLTYCLQKTEHATFHLRCNNSSCSYWEDYLAHSELATTIPVSLIQCDVVSVNRFSLGYRSVGWHHRNLTKYSWFASIEVTLK